SANNRSYQSLRSNRSGKAMEYAIEAACEHYRRTGKAHVVKVPEPFMVLKLNPNKKSFTGKFIGNAEPDFSGSLQTGQHIAFESKYTSSDRIQKKAVSDKQNESLELYYQVKAVVGVCVGIKRTYAFIPWNIWRNMKEIYGRQYMTEEEIKKYQVPTPGYIDFLKGVGK
ncbi:Holliday junction resolvase RecU, partial [Vagococcus carniphilus]|uniref:Holliday junction resolvase RecU n=1 Tax=Vagococcus carniphilus TaxID=218144 RepID=UPI002891638C